MVRTSVAAVAAVLLAAGAAAFRADDTPPAGRKGPMVEKRLMYVEGATADDLAARPGDVVQILPFTYPVAADFLEATLKVEVDDDRCAGVIGQIGTSSVDKQGRTGQSAFLLARGVGSVRVTVTLVGDDQKPIKGYKQTYTLVVK